MTGTDEPLRERLLIAARPQDLSVAPFDAFINRRHRLLELLAKYYELRLVLMRADTDEATVRDDYEPLIVGYSHLERPPDGRLARLAAAARVGVSRPATEGRRLIELAKQSGATRAVTFGPWIDVAFQPIWSVLPSLHMFEEDLRRMPENAPQSRQAKAQRSVEDALVGRARSQPEVVVHISQAEAEPAHHRFPKAQLLWFPYTLEPREWPVASTPSEGERVFVVGQFAEARNAEGLADVLECLPVAAPSLCIVSGAGLHPCLDPHVAAGRLSRILAPNNLYDAYRNSLMTLVPARRATGIKTTILQGWAAGCPVVCFPATAATLGESAADACAVAETPEDMTSLIVSLAGDSAERARLVGAGRSHIQTTFDAKSNERALLERIMEL